MNNPSVYVLNLGCAKNQVDSERILGEFVDAGFDVKTVSDDADVVIINTCGFINDAKEESINEIFNAVEKKKAGQKIIAAGCFSQRYRDSVKEEIPEIDIITGVYRPLEILRALKAEGYACNLPDASKGARVQIDRLPHHSFLKVSEGCSRTCSFCAIPKIRGRQLSRKPEDLVREVSDLVSGNIRELSLIAQDLTYYGMDIGIKDGLTILLSKLLKDTKIDWFRLMYAYPANISDSLMELIASESRICNYLDIPVQHSSSNVLKHMRRGYTGTDLRKIILGLRKRIPDVSLRTTLLVGHPGETERDFQDLIKFMEEFRFERLGGFVYSEEEDTHAFNKSNDIKVSSEVAQERLNILMEVQQKISMEINSEKIGSVRRVLIDRALTDQKGFHFAGRTEADAPEIDNEVLVRGEDAVPGQFCDVKITNAWEFDLEGELVRDNS